MQEQTTGIVLRALKYGETKLIVDFLTERYGRMAAAVKIGSGVRGRSRRMLFQPLTVLSLDVDYRPGRDVQTLGEVSLAMTWRTLGMDPVKMTVGMFLSEVLYHATRHAESDSSLYGFIIGSMRWLDESDTGTANFHIAFLLHLTHQLGYLPSPHDYVPGAVFDLRSGEFMPESPMHPDFLSASDSHVMHSMLRMTYAKMHLFSMSGAERRRVIDIMIKYYRLHLPSFPELKSLAVLHQIFD